MSNIVAIVGRPNVGKSTLFNRLTESRQAIVDQTSGVTRDRQYGKSDWNGKYFSIIDTGGYVMGGDDEFETEIRKQVQLAVDEADIILFLVDAREGLTPMDEDVASMLRKCTKKVLLVANKVDNAKEMDNLAEFYALGLGDPYPIAGISGSGTGDLLDAVVEDFSEGEVDQADTLPRIAVVGRPNVGKSSFINFITGQERNIVTPIAGTTRDSIYTRYNMFGFDFNFVDTAGLRKKSGVEGAADIQRKHTPHAGCLQGVRSLREGLFFPGNDDLSRAVVICDPDIRDGSDRLLDQCSLRADHGSHAADACRDCLRHQLSAHLHGADSIVRAHGARRIKGLIFAEAQSGAHIRLKAGLRHCLKHGDACRHHGRLGKFRPVQTVVQGEQKLRHIHAEKLRRPVDHGLRVRIRLIKAPGHTAFLRALSRKKKCCLRHTAPPFLPVRGTHP